MSESKTLSSHERTVRLTTSAVMIALSTVLSMIPLWKMPLGGSITPFSMLPVCMVSIVYGVKWGLGTSLAYALVQLALDFASAVSWGLSVPALIVCFVVDYFLAFTSLGLAGCLRDKGKMGIVGGVVIAILARYICHVISGGTVFSIWMPEDWSNPWLYSAAYNGFFMLPELIMTTIAAFVLTRVPQIRKMITM